MSSLSIWTYYANNKRKVIPVTGIIVLSILGVSSAGALTQSFFDDAAQEFAFYEHYATIDSRHLTGLSTALIETVASHPAIAVVVSMASPRTRTQGIFGRSHNHIYFVAPAEQRALASRLGWRLVEGRWPEPATNEVAMTQNFLRNRGLRIGDRIGRDVDVDDFLRGEWLIVGAFPATQVTGGIGDLDYRRARFAEPDLPAEVAERPQAVALVPVAGRETEMQAFLDSLPKDDVTVWHRSLARELMADFVANLNMIVWLLNVVGIVVISLSVGLLNVIFFMQRANEFGLLAALGYTKRFLVRRTFLEAAFTVGAGWALGILFSQGVYSAISALLFIPKGLAPLSILTPRVLLFTVPVPITVTLFSVAIVTWQLWRMDPVAIIERRD